MRRFLIVAILTAFCAAPMSAQTTQTPQPLYLSNIGLGFGARALSMGGAFIAIADDITAINYNPAGLAQLLKPEISAGIRYGGQSYSSSGSVTPNLQYGDGNIYLWNPYSSRYTRFDYDYLGAVLPIKIARIPVAFGLAYSKRGSNKASYTFVSDLSYLLTSVMVVQRWHSAVTVIGKGSLSSTSFSVAVRPFDFMYIGGNLNLWRRDMTFNQTSLDENIIWDYTSIFVVDKAEEFKGALSYDIGLLLKTKKVSMGGIFRSAFHADNWSRAQFVLDGDVENSWDYTTRIQWPYSYGVGIAFRPSWRITLSADYNSTHWSGSKTVLNIGAGPRTILDRDTRQFRAGIEDILLTTDKFAVPIRFGFVWDKGSQIDIDGKQVVTVGPTLGTGIATKHFRADLAAIYGRTSFTNSFYTDQAGTPYPESARQAGWDLLLSISYRLGK